MIDKDLLRSDRAALEQALIEAGATIRGNSVKCPFHNDHHPSGSIYERDGVRRFKCMACGAGGDVFDVRALANGTTAADELKKTSRTGAKRQKRQKRATRAKAFANLDGVREFLAEKIGPVEFEHTFTDEKGEYIETEFRLKIPGDKECRPIYLTDGGYVIGAPEKRYLYNLPALAEAETVVVVEGPRKVDVLKRYGFTATSSPGGSKNAASVDWSHLAGKKVIIWRDFDNPGLGYAADVQSFLEPLNPVPRISVIDPAILDLGDSEDVVNFVEQLKVLEKTDAEITTALDEALKTAKAVSIAGDVRQRIADIKSGRYEAIRWPWELVTNLTKALLPGTVTMLAGAGGATKSFASLQLFVFLVLMGVKVALFEAEEDRTFHLTRALAQKSGCGWLTDADLVKERADEADAIAQEHESFLDRFGRIIHAMPEAQPNLEQLAKWVEAQAKKGCRVIGIDPVTVAARTGDVWKADTKFLQAVKRTATDYGCSVLLVSHPVKSQITYPDMSQIAGSACYARFSQTILWLEHHEDKTSKIRTAVGTTEIEHDKTLYILKARNGRGGGFRLAFDFDSETLKLSELGLILSKKKSG